MPKETALSLEQLPRPGDRRIAVYVTPAAERAVRDGHPWLFDRSIRRQSADGRSGDLAVIFDRKGRFLAVGLYDPASPIRVRVLQAEQPAPINREWFRAQLETAVAHRVPLRQTGTTGYRLVHGENDRFPGLVIDRYGQTCVLKLYTAAWIPHLRDVLIALSNVAAPARIVLRLSRGVAAQSGLPAGLSDGEVLAGPPLDGPVHFRENGLYFSANVIQGQKTGFFLDQRENRAQVEPLAAGKTVLNVFAYTGGFSLYAARGKARHVVSLDASQPALDAAKANFRRNQHLPPVAAAVHETISDDAFAALTQMQEHGRLFDLVIIDPPSFAQKQSQVAGAMAAYRKLASLGLAVLRPGGTLVIASCSSRVPADTFFDLIHETARGMKRPLREIERTGHPLDHPIRFPEGAYLKCLFAVAS